jgi:hypothetical protein
MHVPMMKATVPRLNARTVPLPPRDYSRKHADPYLLTTQHREWRSLIVRRAGYRCEHCGAQSQPYRKIKLYADHIRERRRQLRGGAGLNCAKNRNLAQFMSNAERQRRNGGKNILTATGGGF